MNETTTITGYFQCSHDCLKCEHGCIPDTYQEEWSDKEAVDRVITVGFSCGYIRKIEILKATKEDIEWAEKIIDQIKKKNSRLV